MTPISPELALTLNVVASPGVYALLLGSGVSRSAGIPTGWDVVLDLVRKLAQAEGDDPEPLPEEWYQRRYGEPPRYSTLLESVAPTAAERRSLLKEHFEPTEEERDEGIKTPTAAHRAIADLVAGGWIRVIVTTNFDRLLESSLEEAGVRPVVISTPDQIEGAPPLAHNDCAVIKVHGDYLDTRIKNSVEELAEYEQPMNTLLARVFDEYGLVVCGWSGEDDGALRDALDRSRSRRYTTYWCARGDLNPVTKPVADNRAAKQVSISDADAFFTELEERVTSIHTSGERHPMETPAAVETLKRYLPEERHRIRLHDFVRGATEELASHLTLEEFSAQENNTAEAVAARFRQFGILSERTIALLATGCYWGRPEQDSVWTDAVRRLVEADPLKGRSVAGEHTFQYPGLLAFYSVGVAAVEAGRYDMLASLLLIPVRSANSQATEPIHQSMHPDRIVADSVAHILYPHPDAPDNRWLAPRSQHIHRELRPMFADLIPSDDDYDEVFDRFEYLVSLVETDLKPRNRGELSIGGQWFDRRARGFTLRPEGIAERVRKEIDEELEAWPPLQAGLFQGSVERLRAVKDAVDAYWARIRRW